MWTIFLKIVQIADGQDSLLQGCGVVSPFWLPSIRWKTWRDWFAWDFTSIGVPKARGSMLLDTSNIPVHMEVYFSDLLGHKCVIVLC